MVQSLWKCFGNASEDLKNIHISQAIQNREKKSHTKLLNEVQFIITNKLERTEMLQDGGMDKQIMVHSKENVIRLF